MFEPDEDGVYIRIFPTIGRRYLALLAYVALAFVLFQVGLVMEGGVLPRLLLMALGAVLLLGAERLRRATRHGVELTTTGLFDTSGILIVPWDNVEKVERGTFAMKPTNGFSVVLTRPAQRRWAPGLWWRWSTRVGVGGVLNSGQARAMGEKMATLLPQYNNGA